MRKCIIVICLFVCSLVCGCTTNHSPQSVKTEIEYNISLSEKLIILVSDGRELMLIKNKKQIITACEDSKVLANNTINELSNMMLDSDQEIEVTTIIDTITSYISEINTYEKHIKKKQSTKAKKDLKRIKELLNQISDYANDE